MATRDAGCAGGLALTLGVTGGWSVTSAGQAATAEDAILNVRLYVDSGVDKGLMRSSIGPADIVGIGIGLLSCQPR